MAAAEPDGSAPEVWTPWRVAPRSAFEVRGTDGHVALVQIDDSRFLLSSTFRFSDPRVLAMLAERLERDGMPADEARRAIEDARTFTPSTENPTDMASIPRFMRWFENPYGTHTLAAVIHDDLIVSEPNGGALRSDTLADRFFREMMASAGVPWLKRWIMWAAVALRSRWAAGGLRRMSLCLWLLLAVTGILSAFLAIGGGLLGWPHPLDAPVLAILAVVLPLVSAPLWGEQFGASLVAALAALWVLPAALVAAAGFVVYSVLERAARTVGLR